MRAVVRLKAGFSLTLLGRLLALVAMVLPVAASAQTYTARLEPFPYQAMPLGSEPVVNTNINGMGYASGTSLGELSLTYPATLPFRPRFFGQTYDQINILGNGIVTFGDNYKTISRTTSPSQSDSGQKIIPSTTGSYHNFVAVWWDLIICNNTSGSTTGGPLNYQVVGTAPNRYFVIQWTNCRRWTITNGLVDAQLWLSERSSDIEVRYGNIGTGAWSAAMGIENIDGTDGTPGISLRTGASCGITCGVTDFPSNHRIIYSSGPRVELDSVSVSPQPINIGHAAKATAIVSNVGGDAVEDVAVRYWIGPSQLISQAQELGTVTGISIPAGESASLPLDFDTSGLTPGTYFVIAELDPFGDIEPLTEPRQTLVTAAIRVKEATAALRVLGGTVTAPGWVESNATFDVTWDMDNMEVLEVNGAKFAVMLSTDSTIDENDTVLGTGFFSLASNGRISMTKSVTVPAEVPDGRYFVGVWLDPDQAIPHDGSSPRSGNRRASTQPTTVGLELEIVTAELPGGRVGDAYSADLVATGADSNYAWTVVAGSLPNGLSITKVSGANKIVGTPQAPGVFNFTLQATSAQFTDTATYSVEILSALVPLEVVTNAVLPDATVGYAYTVALEARGGVPPYEFAIDSGTLPAGLTLSSTGRLGGTPLERGSFPIFVKVTDSAGTSVVLLFTVAIEIEELVCKDVKNLAPVMVGEALHPVQLRATGGKAPYTWTSKGGDVPGLTLSPAGEITGTPTTAGAYDWTAEVADELASTARCHVTLVVTDLPKETTLEITTDTLARARVFDSYEATLEATGVTGNVTWSLGVDGALPDGLFLTEDGVIRGVPSAASLGGEKTRVLSFEVVATDSAHKVARATLSLELFDDRPDPKPVTKTTTKKEGGCQSTAGDAGLLTLGLALGLATLVRRRR